jgi:hypothetical protein
LMELILAPSSKIFWFVVIWRNKHIIPLNLIFPLAWVRSGIYPNSFLRSTMSGLISTEKKNPANRMQKNCIECSCAHNQCLFDSTHDVSCTCCLSCTHCRKFHLNCNLRYSGMIWSLLYLQYLLSYEIPINLTLWLLFIIVLFQNRVTAMS